MRLLPSTSADRSHQTAGPDGGLHRAGVVASFLRLVTRRRSPPGPGSLSRAALATTAVIWRRAGSRLISVATTWAVPYRASGEAHQFVAGLMAPPKWLPDGESLVFAFSSLGEGQNEPGIWQVQADGHQFREVVEAPTYFPVWLPPA